MNPSKKELAEALKMACTRLSGEGTCHNHKCKKKGFMSECKPCWKDHFLTQARKKGEKK